MNNWWNVRIQLDVVFFIICRLLLLPHSNKDIFSREQWSKFFCDLIIVALSSGFLPLKLKRSIDGLRLQ